MILQALSLMMVLLATFGDCHLSSYRSTSNLRLAIELKVGE